MSITLAKEIYQLMADECEMAMAVVDVLFEEQSCLIQLQSEKLQPLALKKEAMMLELEQRYLANAQRAQSHGYEPNLKGLEKWLESLSAHEPRLSGTFLTLKDTLAQAKRLNELNASLVAEQMAGLQARINILTAAAMENQNPGQPSNTYGPKGSIDKGVAGAMPRAVIR